MVPVRVGAARDEDAVERLVAMGASSASGDSAWRSRPTSRSTPARSRAAVRMLPGMAGSRHSHGDAVAGLKHRKERQDEAARRAGGGDRSVSASTSQRIGVTIMSCDPRAQRGNAGGCACNRIRRGTAQRARPAMAVLGADSAGCPTSRLKRSWPAGPPRSARRGQSRPSP